jgi:hypothetical protein
LQYWLLWLRSASCSCLYTPGKNLMRNGFIDVTPPGREGISYTIASYLFRFFAIKIMHAQLALMVAMKEPVGVRQVEYKNGRE